MHWEVRLLVLQNAWLRVNVLNNEWDYYKRGKKNHSFKENEFVNCILTVFIVLTTGSVCGWVLVGLYKI